MVSTLKLKLRGVMIFRTKRKLILDENDATILNVEYDGDNYVMRHAQKIDGILASNQEARKDDGNGFTKDRSMRFVASIPELEFIKRPELIRDLSGNTMKRFLRSDEAAPFRRVRKGL